MLDAIIVSTISFPYPTRRSRPLLAGELGRPDVIAYDISAACAGFAYGIGKADSLIRRGAARHVLVIGAEKLSDFVDPHRPLDLVPAGRWCWRRGRRAQQRAEDRPRPLWGSDGERLEHDPHDDSPSTSATGTARLTTLEQDGRTVFRWAVWHTAKKIREMLEQSAHRPSRTSTCSSPTRRTCGSSMSSSSSSSSLRDVVIGRDIAETGNTSAASIPLATHRLIEEGTAKSGDVLVQFGFGAGLAYAGQVLILP